MPVFDQKGNIIGYNNADPGSGYSDTDPDQLGLGAGGPNRSELGPPTDDGGGAGGQGQGGGGFWQGFPPAGGPGTGYGSRNATDPFAYTGGSLLTPWTEQFQNPYGQAPGYNNLSPYAFSPYSAGQLSQPQSFSYDPMTMPGQAPGSVPFSFQSLSNPGTFQAPTADQAANTPGYQFALKQGLDAMLSSASAKGTVGTGATLKALNDYAQQSAGQQYNNVLAQQQGIFSLNAQTQMGAQAQQFGQAQSAAQMNFQNPLAAYQANTQTQLAAQGQQYGQAAQAAQLNSGNVLAYYQAQQAAQQQAAQLNTQQAQFGYQNALQQNQFGSQMGQQAYSTNYQNAVNQYLMGYQQFQTNQQNQYSRLMGQSQLGLSAAQIAAGQGQQSVDNQGNLITGAGNAAAAGTVGAANAWNGAFSQIGNAAMMYPYMSSLTQPAQQGFGRGATLNGNPITNAGFGHVTPVVMN